MVETVSPEAIETPEAPPGGGEGVPPLCADHVANSALLLPLPVHGPHGRIAAVRRRLGLTQRDLAVAVSSFGGRASRETVSRWENVDANGCPRARMGALNAAAFAALSTARGLPLASDLFIERAETPVEAVVRRQAEITLQLEQLVLALRRIATALELEGAELKEVLT